MTRLDPQLPPREVTPQERARSARTFGLILLGFALVVGVTVAYLSVRGRQVRDYGQAVYAAAQTSLGPTGTAQATADVPCAQVWPRPAPAAVQSCVVRGRGAQMTVVLSAGEGREFRVPPRSTSP